MSQCKDCQEAEHHDWRSYKTGCASCQARMLAHGEEAKKSRAAGIMTDGYRSALNAVFGDAWREGHEEVRRWAGIIESTSQDGGR